MVVQYPRTVWKNSYAEHEVAGTIEKRKKEVGLICYPGLVISHYCFDNNNYYYNLPVDLHIIYFILGYIDI